MDTSGRFVAEAGPLHHETNHPLLGAGIALILVGYFASAITDTLGGTVFGRYYSSAVGIWPAGWVPFFHWIAAIDGQGTWGLVSGVLGGLSTAMEIAGLVMAIIGQNGHSVRPRAGALVGRLGAPGAQAGFSLDLAF